MIRAGLGVAAGLAAAVLTLPAAFAASSRESAVAGTAATAAGCTLRLPTPDQPGPAGIPLTQQQMRNAQVIVAVAGRRGLPEPAAAIALMTAMQESSLINLDHGDLAGPTSRGLFQQKPEFYPGVDVNDPASAASAFYDRLLTVPDYLHLPMPSAAQAVQHSADGSRYARWQDFGLLLAATLYGRATGTTACGSTDTHAGPDAASAERISAALAAARSQLGRPYVWGGGNANGPTGGPSPGFDCSGLMIYAWARAGVTLTHSSREQYHAGTHVPLAEARAGDLIFLAHDTTDPATIHHVAMITGPGEIVEAQTTGVPVHIRRFAGIDEPHVMPLAVRLAP